MFFLSALGVVALVSAEVSVSFFQGGVFFFGLSDFSAVSSRFHGTTFFFGVVFSAALVPGDFKSSWDRSSSLQETVFPECLHVAWRLLMQMRFFTMSTLQLCKSGHSDPFGQLPFCSHFTQNFFPPLDWAAFTLLLPSQKEMVFMRLAFWSPPPPALLPPPPFPRLPLPLLFWFSALSGFASRFPHGTSLAGT